jgi:hypothetical protein
MGLGVSIWAVLLRAAVLHVGGGDADGIVTSDVPRACPVVGRTHPIVTGPCSFASLACSRAVLAPRARGPLALWVCLGEPSDGRGRGRGCASLHALASGLSAFRAGSAALSARPVLLAWIAATYSSRRPLPLKATPVGVQRPEERITSSRSEEVCRTRILTILLLGTGGKDYGVVGVALPGQLSSCLFDGRSCMLLLLPLLGASQRAQVLEVHRRKRADHLARLIAGKTTSSARIEVP